MTWLQNLAGAALAVLAAGGPALAQSALAQSAVTPPRSGSVLTFTGLARAQDVGLPGVAVRFQNGGAVLVDGAASTRSFDDLPAVGTIADFRVGVGAQPIAQFLTVGGYTFSLASLPAGPYGPGACYNNPRDPADGRPIAVGQVCTPYQGLIGNPRPGVDPLSPFYMANVPSTVLPDSLRLGPIASTVAFNLAGTVAGPRGPERPFFGTIYSVFPFAFQDVLRMLEDAGSQGAALPNDIPFFGTFVVGGRGNGVTGFAEMDPADVATTVTPEPSAVLLLGAGLAGAGAVLRRRRGA